MWPFGKSKKSKKNNNADDGKPDIDSLGKTEAQRALLRNMRAARSEIGEENLQKMAEKLKLEDLKKQVRSDIDTDEKKRDRLLDELRYTLSQDEK